MDLGGIHLLALGSFIVFWMAVKGLIFMFKDPISHEFLAGSMKVGGLILLAFFSLVAGMGSVIYMIQTA